MSRDELADAAAQWLAARDPQGREVALDGVHVGKLERGVVRRPRDHYVAALCAVLGATEAELGFVDLIAEISWSVVSMLPAPEPWEIVYALTRTTVNTAILDHLERAALGCAAQYPSTPPRALLASVSHLMARVRDILSQPQQLQMRKRCVIMLGFLSGLAGSLWFDLGRSGKATEFFDVGELAGHEANDPDLTAWLLTTRSIVPFFAGRYAEASQLPTRAEEAAAAQSSARRRAWIASLRARAVAASGDRDQGLAALDRAEHQLSQVVDPPTGADFFDAPRLEGMAGSTYMLMSDASGL